MQVGFETEVGAPIRELSYWPQVILLCFLPFFLAVSPELNFLLLDKFSPDAAFVFLIHMLSTGQATSTCACWIVNVCEGLTAQVCSWQEGGLPRDSRWSCAAAESSYPAYHHSLAHPCAGGGDACCGTQPGSFQLC